MKKGLFIVFEGGEGAGKSTILDKIYDSILNLDEYLSLGRKEDLVRIDNVRFVEVDEYEVDDYKYRINDMDKKQFRFYTLKNNIYIH